jgi:hypothetical protein
MSGNARQRSFLIHTEVYVYLSLVVNEGGYDTLRQNSIQEFLCPCAFFNVNEQMIVNFVLDFTSIFPCEMESSFSQNRDFSVYSEKKKVRMDYSTIYGRAVLSIMVS